MNKNKYKFGTMNHKTSVNDLKGPKHEQGGIQINPKTELEGGEAEFDGFVFSNRLIFGDKGKTFADKANSIERKYKNDDSPEAITSKKRELSYLAEQQESTKQEMLASMLPEGMLDGMEEGERKMFLGGAIAQGVGSLVNMGRGIFEKPRQYDPIELERATANTIDLGEQRTSAQLGAERGRISTNQTIRDNAGSAGQLLGNTLVNNARTTDDLNRVLAESYMNEENVNAQIENQVDQFNTQIGNQETLQNFQIDQQNAMNRDAKRELLFQGIGGLLQGAGNLSNDMFNLNREKATIGALTDLGPNQIESLFGDLSIGNLLGFLNKKRQKNSKPSPSGSTMATGGIYG